MDRVIYLAIAPAIETSRLHSLYLISRARARNVLRLTIRTGAIEVGFAPEDLPVLDARSRSSR